MSSPWVMMTGAGGAMSGVAGSVVGCDADGCAGCG
jgi:hypothetical protein